MEIFSTVSLYFCYIFVIINTVYLYVCLSLAGRHKLRDFRVKKR